jgi:hypothetical protein
MFTFASTTAFLLATAGLSLGSARFFRETTPTFGIYLYVAGWIFFLGGLLMSFGDLNGSPGLCWQVAGFTVAVLPGLSLPDIILLALPLTMLADCLLAIGGFALARIALKLGEAIDKRVYGS